MNSDFPFGLQPSLRVEKDGLLKVVRSAWRNRDLELPGFNHLLLCHTDAPIWGADEEMFGWVVTTTFPLKGDEEEVYFQLDEQDNVFFYTSDEFARNLACTILAIADEAQSHKFTKVAVPANHELENFARIPWVTPRFILIIFFEDFDGGLEQNWEFLFDFDVHSDYTNEAEEDPHRFLGRLNSNYFDFMEQNRQFFNEDWRYVGPRVEPQWMADYDPKNYE